MKKKIFAILRDYGIITLSCFIYAFAFECFFQPNNLAMGGFTGISQILNALCHYIPVGTAVIVLNIPLMILGVKKQGLHLLFSTVFATTVSSLLIDILAARFTFAPMDPLLACLYGGLVMGIGLGLMLLKNATTGGTELAARLLKYKIRHLSIGKLCLAIDAAVLCLYAAVFHRLDSALYGVVAMYVCSIVMDMIVYGSINAKLAYIISDKCEEITQALLKMDLGATILNGKGAFTGNSKNVLMCAVKPTKIAQIKALVAEIDPEKAFVIVTDAKEVYGEGFGEHGDETI